MKRNFELFQGVHLKRDLHDPDICAGTRGVVMDLLPRDGLAVEFFDKEGNTIDVAMIPESYVRAGTPEEDEEARLLSARLNAHP